MRRITNPKCQYLSMLFRPLLMMLLVFLSAHSHAKQQTGTWVGECKMQGQAVTCQSIWSLGHSKDQVIQNYKISEPKSGKTLFTATGIYLINDKIVSGLWYDSAGSHYRLTGTWDDDSMTVVWIGEGLDIGRSVYTFKEGNLRATDALLKGDSFSVFQQIDYGKQQELH